MYKIPFNFDSVERLKHSGQYLLHCGINGHIGIISSITLLANFHPDLL